MTVFVFVGKSRMILLMVPSVASMKQPTTSPTCNLWPNDSLDPQCTFVTWFYYSWTRSLSKKKHVNLIKLKIKVSTCIDHNKFQTNSVEWNTHVVAIEGPGVFVVSQLHPRHAVGLGPADSHGTRGHHLELEVPLATGDRVVLLHPVGPELWLAQSARLQ